MTGWLDEAIERSSGPVLDFLTELRATLEEVQPAALDAERSGVSTRGKLTELRLAHAHDERWSIWAELGETSVALGFGDVHEHIGKEWSGDRERSWTTVAVDLVADILRGQVEVVTTYRGAAVASVTHRRVGGGDLGTTGFLAALKVWRPKRTEVERVDFGAR